MDKIDLVMGIVELAGKKIRGRTTIQKLAYFAEVQGISDVAYKPHYYGPYSDDIANTLDMLVGLGLIEERTRILGPQSDAWLQSVSGDIKAYTYSLTSKGSKQATEIQKNHPEEWRKLANLVGQCKQLAGLSPGILAAAAKVHYIASQPGANMSSPAKVTETAKRLGWKLGTAQISRVQKLLSKLDLLPDS
jgi:uncharacterized protein